MAKIYKPTISKPQKGEWLPKLKCCKRNKQSSLSALLNTNASEVPTSYLKKCQCSGYLVKRDDLLIFSLVLCHLTFFLRKSSAEAWGSGQMVVLGGGGHWAGQHDDNEKKKRDLKNKIKKMVVLGGGGHWAGQPGNIAEQIREKIDKH